MGFVPHVLPHIKRIYVYVNGDAYQPASSIIVHPRRIRNYEVFLKDLTEKIRPPYGAVRNVYTPVNGSRVNDLEDLENHQNYVAAGREAFRKLAYIDIEEMQAKRQVVKVKTQTKPAHNVPKVSRPSRRKQYHWEPITIYVYSNGDDVSPAKKLKIIRSDLENWDNLLLKVGEKLDQQGFIRRLYTLNGEWIRDGNGIKNSQQYVAVGSYEQFKRVMYGKLIRGLPKNFLNEPAPAPAPAPKPKPTKTSSTPSLPVKKTALQVKLPKFIKRPKLGNKDESSKKKEVGVTVNRKLVTLNRTNGTKGVKEKSVAVGKEKPVPVVANKQKVEYLKKPFSNTPVRVKTTNVSLPTLKNVTKKAIVNEKRDNEKILKDKRVTLQKTNQKLKKDGKSPDSEDSAYMSENEGKKKKKSTLAYYNKDPQSRVYFAPTKKIKPQKVAVVNYDEDSGGIYRAKNRHPASNNAKEVKELKHLPVELPIDEVEAVEVGSEMLTRHEEVDEEDTEDEVKESSEDDTYRDKPDSSESSPESNKLESPQHKSKQVEESTYQLPYNRELQASARTA